MGRHVEATADLDELAVKEPLGNDLFNAASVYSLSALAALQDDALPTEERKRMADAYKARAIKLLRTAQTGSFFDTPGRRELLKTNADLESLRSSEEFQRLCAEIQRKAKEEKRPE
jgi:hypothetical protein